MTRSPADQMGSCPATGPTRRAVLTSLSVAATAPLVIGAAPPAFPARQLDFSLPADNLYGLLKLMGDLSDTRTHILQYGSIYAVTERKLPRHILSYTGLTTREIRPDGPHAYASRYGGWMLMQDPITGQVIDTWPNPLTRALLPVEHFVTSIGKQRFTQNGIERPPGYRGEFQWFDRPFVLPWHSIGDDVWAPYEQFSAYEDRAGNARFENAIHTYHGQLSRLTRAGSTAPGSIASQSQSPYFPWMKMDAAGGHMLLQSAGRKLSGLHEIPADVIAAVERRFPGQLARKFDWSA